MIKSIIIDDEQHCIDALIADLSKNCSNVEVVAKCASGKEGILAIKKYKPRLIFPSRGSCPHETLSIQS